MSEGMGVGPAWDILNEIDAASDGLRAPSRNVQSGAVRQTGEAGASNLPTIAARVVGELKWYSQNWEGKSLLKRTADDAIALIEQLVTAQAMSAGTAETVQPAQGDSPPARSEGCAQPQSLSPKKESDNG